MTAAALMTWPALDRLARRVRAADLLTRTLAAETGHGISTEHLDVHDGPADLGVRTALDLREGAQVQHREVVMRAGGIVVACARSQVATGCAALTPAARMALRLGGSTLGEVLAPLGHRRHTLSVVRHQDAMDGDLDAVVLSVTARLDVNGTPVAWCVEKVMRGVFAMPGK
ncbi:MAG: hypothetical protein H7Y15_02070 [Pseudonocardia sp.]|nr:hypothetical protein [Pseudonocardia sp.]